MFKILTYLASFFIGRYQSVLKPSYLVIIDQMLVRTRKLMMTSMISLVAALLFTGGVIISLIEFTSQIDNSGVVWPSATLVGGLVMTFLSLGTLIYAFTSRNFDLRYIRPSTLKRNSSSVFSNMTDEQVTAPPRQPSPLEDALGVLVMDFVNERRESRLKEQAEVRTENRTSEAPYVAPQASTESTRSTYENTTLQ